MHMPDYVDGSLPVDMYQMLTGLTPPDLADGEEQAGKSKEGRRVIFERPRGSDAVYVCQYTTILKLDPK